MDYLQYRKEVKTLSFLLFCFKPCYKWITFNTKRSDLNAKQKRKVLNLVINGLPSIL